MASGAVIKNPPCRMAREVAFGRDGKCPISGERSCSACSLNGRGTSAGTEEVEQKSEKQLLVESRRFDA